MKLLSLFLVFLQTYHLHAVDVYVHMMPWFETKDTNNGTWGIHWTMANKDPDNVVGGLQELASFYHPQIGAYASGDTDVVDWQLGTMKIAGIAGVFIDWPGTYEMYDYVSNRHNSEAIIAGTDRAGLKFAIVYEDNNLNLAFVPDQIGQATLDMAYVQQNYISKSNYVHIGQQPLLMDFGPQVLYEKMWDDIFTPIEPKPAFLTLWNQHLQGGTYCAGEYAWVWMDYLDGLNTWYTNFPSMNVTVQVGVAYPGFQPFYAEGGWGGPAWTIDYAAATFQATFDLAAQHTDLIQVCTWNDYGEGTIIEPTVEFGTTYVDLIQRATKSKYRHEDFEENTRIYFLRKEHANNGTRLEELRQQYHNLVHKYD